MLKIFAFHAQVCINPRYTKKQNKNTTGCFKNNYFFFNNGCHTNILKNCENFCLQLFREM